MTFYRVQEGVIHVSVRVQPRASREHVVGVHDGALKIALTAPPVDGAANEALTRYLAKKLGIARRDVEIVQGATGRLKVVALRGTTREAVESLTRSGERCQS